MFSRLPSPRGSHDPGHPGGPRDNSLTWSGLCRTLKAVTVVVTTQGWAGLPVIDMSSPLTTCTERSLGAMGSEVTVMSQLPSTPSHWLDTTWEEGERESTVRIIHTRDQIN